MALFEDKGPSLSGSQQSNFLSEAIAESEHFRADYATLPNVINAEDMPWERSPDGLIKHLVNKKMHTRECCMEDVYKRQASPRRKLRRSPLR